MPNFDGTGPEGRGPKTGRGLGNCEGSQTNQPFFGRGRGWGAGRGRGFGRGAGRGRGFGRGWRWFGNNNSADDQQDE